MTARVYLSVIAAAAALLTALTAAGAWGLARIDHPLVIWVMLTASLPFAAAAWIVIRHGAEQDGATSRRALVIILGTAALTRVLLLPWPPVSTDVYRYVWDGRVQAAGINPYRYLPADEALAPLRDAAVYPHINRAATAPTIYPPLAQFLFLSVARLSDSVTAMKLAMIAFETASIAALLALMRRRGLPATRVILYAWHPLAVFEFAGSGHIDAAAIAFMLLSCVAADRRRPGMAGALLAAGTLVKFFPLVIAPALYRRWDWRAPLVGLAVTLALYLVYAGVGWGVFGFLPGYAQEENLTTGEGFFLLAALGRVVELPSWAPLAYVALGISALFAAALVALTRGDARTASMSSALLLVAIFTLLLSPHLAWYFTWLIPFLCFVPLWSLIYLTGAAPLLYGLAGFAHDFARSSLIYLPFATILAIELWFRMRDRTPERFSHVSTVEP